VERRSQEVNWLSYFDSIKGVCPHSLDSFQRDRIKLVPFFHLFKHNNWFEYSTTFDAILFIGDNKVSLGLLKNLVDYLEHLYPDNEFFYSYPDEGEYSTPVPVLIMQSKEILNQARKEYKQKIRR
tara:strand:+ start:2476 stop:2850 length:375 start_codon:yes stop_codon:yes gene_type:complete